MVKEWMVEVDREKSESVMGNDGLMRGNTKFVPSCKAELVWFGRLCGGRVWKEFVTRVGMLSDMRGGRVATPINGSGVSKSVEFVLGGCFEDFLPPRLAWEELFLLLR